MNNLFHYILELFLLTYSLFMLVIIAYGFYRQQAKERIYELQEPSIDISDITILIPFRNEENRIGQLLKSINDLKSQPNEYIFIDDHSTDNGVELIKSRLTINNYRILHVPNETQGKKEALRYGSEHVKTKMILTIDADVLLPVTYFSKLGELGKADMYVLPAIMQPVGFIQYLFEIDLILVNAANAGLAGLKRPIVASGANLLYSKETFDEVDDLSSHAHMASGDDTYLLRDFRENNCDVRVHTNPEIGIYTETPQSFKEFIDQRLRWIGKTGDLKDHLSTTLALLQAMFTFTFVLICAWFIYKSNWSSLLSFFLIKTAIDGMFFFPYFNRIKRLKTWLFIAIYELIFPFYSLLILLLLMVYKPKWKGRKIYAKKG